MLTNKANVLCILEILREYSDADNIMKMGDIISKMESFYNLHVDRRTVYSSIAVLTEMGYDISVFEENKVGYYLRSREFDVSEIRLIMDCVYVNSAIPQRQTEQLIKKLQSLLPRGKRKSYKNLTVTRSGHKTLNKEVFWNIELIDTAISERKKVSFTYMKYGFDKKLVPRRNEPYTVSPYALVVSNEKYYMLANCAEHYNEISHFRIDKIKNICLLTEQIIPPPKGFSTSKYRDDVICMLGGEAERIVLKCDNSILDMVIDKFGQDVRITPNDDNTFNAVIHAAPHGVQLWAAGHMDKCEMLEPVEARNGIVEIIKNNKYRI